MEIQFVFQDGVKGLGKEISSATSTVEWEIATGDRKVDKEIVKGTLGPLLNDER